MAHQPEMTDEPTWYLSFLGLRVKMTCAGGYLITYPRDRWIYPTSIDGLPALIAQFIDRSGRSRADSEAQVLITAIFDHNLPITPFTSCVDECLSLSENHRETIKFILNAKKSIRFQPMFQCNSLKFKDLTDLVPFKSRDGLNRSYIKCINRQVEMLASQAELLASQATQMTSLSTRIQELEDRLDYLPGTSVHFLDAAYNFRSRVLYSLTQEE